MGEFHEYQPSEEESRGEKAEFGKYVLQARFVGREGSSDPNTVIAIVDAWSGSTQIFGGGDGRTFKRFLVEMSNEGFEKLRKNKSGEIGYIVGERKMEDGTTVWITDAALKAKSADRSEQ